MLQVQMALAIVKMMIQQTICNNGRIISIGKDPEKIT